MLTAGKSLWANAAAAAAALSAGTVVVVTSVLVARFEPAALACIRYAIAVLCLAPTLYFVWPRARITAPDVARIFALGIVFFGLFPWAFTAALAYTTPARGAIGLATMPIQTLVVAVLLRREKLTGFNAASVVLAFVGIVIVFGPEALAAGDSTYLVGDLLMLFGVFNSAVYIVLSKPTIAKFGAMFVTTFAMLAGVLFLFTVAFANGDLDSLPVPLLDDWLAFTFLGVIGGAVQFALFVWALGLLAPTRAAIYLVLSPLSAILLSILLLGESVNAALVLGLLAIVCAIFINSRRH